MEVKAIGMKERNCRDKMLAESFTWMKLGEADCKPDITESL